MKSRLAAIIFILAILGMPFQSLAQNAKVISLNIRYDAANDGRDIWENRKTELAGLINYYRPDILGLQEGLKHQLDFIGENLTGYAMIGAGREDGKQKGEYTAIFYDTIKYHLIQEATFWLSETSDTPSIGWDAAFERICTYGLFEHKTMKTRVWVFNTHYDHIGILAREKSSELILKKMDIINVDNTPVIFMGDLNSEPDSRPIQTLQNDMQDGQQISSTEFYGPNGTFNGFDKEAKLERRIDYLFVKNLKVISYRHIDDRMKNGNWVSDHLPVIMEIEFPGTKKP